MQPHTHHFAILSLVLYQVTHGGFLGYNIYPLVSVVCCRLQCAKKVLGGCISVSN